MISFGNPRWFRRWYNQRRRLAARGTWPKGAIPWGTDLSTIAPTQLTAVSDVDCVAGTWTTALNSNDGTNPLPIQMVNRFDVYPYLAGVLNITFGVSAPTALSISYALVSGTPIATYTLEPGELAILTEFILPIFLFGPSSSSAYSAAAFNPLIEVNPTTNDVTVNAIGSSVLFQLFPGVE